MAAEHAEALLCPCPQLAVRAGGWLCGGVQAARLAVLLSPEGSLSSQLGSSLGGAAEGPWFHTFGAELLPGTGCRPVPSPVLSAARRRERAPCTEERRLCEDRAARNAGKSS